MRCDRKAARCEEVECPPSLRCVAAMCSVTPGVAATHLRPGGLQGVGPRRSVMWLCSDCGRRVRTFRHWIRLTAVGGSVLGLAHLRLGTGSCARGLSSGGGGFAPSAIVGLTYAGHCVYSRVYPRAGGAAGRSSRALAPQRRALARLLHSPSRSTRAGSTPRVCASCLAADRGRCSCHTHLQACGGCIPRH